MKFRKMIPAAVCMAALLTGCKETMSVDIAFGEAYAVSSEKLAKYDSISWSSDNEAVAAVNDAGEIVGGAPGTAVLTAASNDKTVAEVTVNVSMLQKDVDVTIGTPYDIDGESPGAYDGLVWVSSDENVASVNEQGEIDGNTPGSAVLTAQKDEETVAELSVNVTVIPATGIVLSTNSTEITVDDGFQLSYSLFPDNASDYGIAWRSADESVAIVNEQGFVLAKQAGQTTISASNADGVMATCAVTVKEKPAYERLSAKEKAFVDCLLDDLDTFKNPASVKVVKIDDDGVNAWKVQINAMNGFGGMNNTCYFLDTETGFWNWDMLDIDIDITVRGSSEYDIDLINEAIDEKR